MVFLISLCVGVHVVPLRLVPTRGFRLVRHPLHDSVIGPMLGRIWVEDIRTLVLVTVEPVVVMRGR